METSVPISGEYPFLGPTMVSDSWESGGCARRGSPEKPAVSAALDLRKLRRPGKHSDANMVVSAQRLTDGGFEGMWRRYSGFHDGTRDEEPFECGATATKKTAEPFRTPNLLASEALEVGHLALHFLAGGVGGGADTLNAQLEFVGVGSASESFVESDELLRVKIEERLIERLHAVLAGAGGDGVVNQARLVRVDDAIADVAGGDHDFASRHAAFVIRAAHQALRDDGLQRGGKLQTNLFLFRRREDRDNTLNCFRGVESVQSGKNQVAGFRGEQRGGNSFEVAHFADQNHVGVLTQSGAQGSGEVRGVHFDFALVDEALLVAVQELDGVFDSDQVVGAVGVDAVDHGRQGGGLTGTGGSGDEDQAALLFANLVDDRGEIQFFIGANFRGNDAEHHADVAALLKDVDTEAAQPRNAIGHIQFRCFFELLFLAVGHHAERHGKHFFGGDARHVGERGEQAVHAQIGVVADFQVQVGGLAFDRAPEKIVNADCHVV